MEGVKKCFSVFSAPFCLSLFSGLESYRCKFCKNVEMQVLTVSLSDYVAVLVRQWKFPQSNLELRVLTESCFLDHTQLVMMLRFVFWV